jgi:hypothetical protein
VFGNSNLADPDQRTDVMSIAPPDREIKPRREWLSNRRGNLSVPLEYEGHTYRTTAGWFDDGRLAEIFLHTGKAGTQLQANADTASILVSLLLQHRVAPQVILHSISGPIAIALQMFMGEAP